MDTASSNTQNNNYLPGFESADWRFWSPRKDLSPDFSKDTADSQTILKIKSNAEFNSYGKWQCTIGGIKGSDTGHWRVSIKI